MKIEKPEGTKQEREEKHQEPRCGAKMPKGERECSSEGNGRERGIYIPTRFYVPQVRNI